MLTPNEAHELLGNLVTAWQQVGEVLTGKPVMVPAAGSGDLRSTAGRLAHYAWDGEWSSSVQDLEAEVHELATAIELIQGNFMLPDGAELFGLQEKEALRKLANAVTAREHLDNGESITIEMLAALAGVSEKTVRTATNPKSPHPIGIVKAGHWTWIEAKEALAWLSRRPSFRPTRLQEERPTQPTPVDAATMQRALPAWLSAVEMTADDAIAALKWPAQQSNALHTLLAGNVEDVFPGLGPRHLRELAELVGMPEPSAFARQGYQALAVAHAEAVSTTELSDAAR